VVKDARQISAFGFTAKPRNRHRRFTSQAHALSMAVKTTVNGITFASAIEAQRYAELCLLVRAGEIQQLEVQPRYPLVVNGRKVTTFIADFRYYDRIRKKHVVEDVKPKTTGREEHFQTRLSQVKIALFNALFADQGLQVDIIRR